ncbi:MAG TPA: translesion error-prone DNA polymerase V autoproteolytic subunit [Bacillota bacterium]|jgi:DNA polymerase V|nr:translesion error-prone DNA polymerase V autoproteolytic subunit [Bacillota bacterium]HOL09586.1 translesion error-prone DNA polymerase V autoproteolytic subunit [Bacillota bacterium]HPO97253.1 translesion error-prone DNA polymerase V autoproteolytic subunit [Bacillota bacterium]
MMLEFFAVDTLLKLELQYTGQQITAGFPSPAEDYLETKLDLNNYLVKNPSATFYGRVKGFSMKDAGVDDGDLLIIDKSLGYRNGALAVCFINGEFTLKKINTDHGRLLLMPANEAYQPIEVKAEDDFMVWGIVTHIIKKVY